MLGYMDLHGFSWISTDLHGRRFIESNRKMRIREIHRKTTKGYAQEYNDMRGHAIKIVEIQCTCKYYKHH
jgi:hypothetical protein